LKNQDLQALLRVDALDAKAAKLRRELRDIPEDLAKHREALKKEQERVALAHDAQKTLQKEIQKLELEVKSNDEQAKKYAIQQNSAKTNEEYATLRKQIEALKKANGELEDRELQLYERLDALKADEKAAKEAVKQAEAKLAEEEAGVKKELAQIEEELARVLAEREAAAKAVASEVMALYRRIVDKVKGRAMAPVRNRICQGCFMQIPMDSYTALVGEKDVITCKSCSRILFLEDDTRATLTTSFSVSDKTREATSKDGNW
jgi:hypothetical protein